ncbi:MAG: hypothetical protein WC607_03335 [Candidatus Micrarchaeia archaeon]
MDFLVTIKHFNDLIPAFCPKHIVNNQVRGFKDYYASQRRGKLRVSLCFQEGDFTFKPIIALAFLQEIVNFPGFDALGQAFLLFPDTLLKLRDVSQRQVGIVFRLNAHIIHRFV